MADKQKPTKSGTPPHGRRASAPSTSSSADRSARRSARNIIVMKFGGTSVADATCMKRVANRIVEARKEGHPVVAVVSARGDTTDELIEMAKEISDNPPAREMDMLLSTGERISAALVAMAIHELGYDAISLTGSQAGIVTDTVHTKAKILDIRPQPHPAGPRGGQDRPGGRLPGSVHRAGRHHPRPRRLRHHGGGSGRRARAPRPA